MKRLAVGIEIETDGRGGLNLRMKPVDPTQRLDAIRSTVVLTLWTEAPDTLRARAENLSTGSAGYFQGNATLMALCAELGLRLVSI